MGETFKPVTEFVVPISLDDQEDNKEEINELPTNALKPTLVEYRNEDNAQIAKLKQRSVRLEAKIEEI